MLLKKLNKHCLEPFLHAQEAMTLYGAMNYGSAPIITPLAPTPSSSPAWFVSNNRFLFSHFIFISQRGSKNPLKGSNSPSPPPSSPLIWPLNPRYVEDIFIYSVCNIIVPFKNAPVRLLPLYLFIYKLYTSKDFKSTFMKKI